jgi:hypothetical protein
MIEGFDHDFREVASRADQDDLKLPPFAEGKVTCHATLSFSVYSALRVVMPRMACRI